MKIYTLSLLASLTILIIVGCSNESEVTTTNDKVIRLIEDPVFLKSVKEIWGKLSENQQKNVTEGALDSLNIASMNEDTMQFTNSFCNALDQYNRETVNTIAIKNGSHLTTSKLSLRAHHSMALRFTSIRKNVSLKVTIRLVAGRKTVWQSEKDLKFANPSHWQSIELEIPGQYPNASLQFEFYSPDKGLYVMSLPVLIPLKKHNTKQPNVIVVSLDTVRADHLGFWDYHRNTSPTLDSIAEDGITFMQAYAPSGWTLPSHKSILSGYYPNLFDYYSNSDDMHKKELTGEIRLLQYFLQAAGYYTIAFTGGGFVSSSFGFYNGFDRFVESKWGNAAYDDPETNGKIKHSEFDNAIDWLNLHAEGGPFFMFLHTYAAHEPYVAPENYTNLFGENRSKNIANNITWLEPVRKPEHPPEEDVEQVVRLYDRGLRWLDDELAKLLRVLKSKSILDSTILVILSDHGELFDEHNAFGHKTLWNSQLLVPLIVHYPAVFPEGRKVNNQVSLVDVTPTILDLLSLRPSEEMHGESLLRFVHENTDTATIPIFSSQNRRLAVQKGSYRLKLSIVPKNLNEESFRSDITGLFDIKNDPGELNNLLNSQHDSFKGSRDNTFKELRALGFYYLAQTTPGINILITNPAVCKSLELKNLSIDSDLQKFGRAKRKILRFETNSSEFDSLYYTNAVPQEEAGKGLFLYSPSAIDSESELSFGADLRISINLNFSRTSKQVISLNSLRNRLPNPQLFEGIPFEMLDKFDMLVWKTDLPFEEHQQKESIFSDETADELRNLGYLQ